MPSIDNIERKYLFRLTRFVALFFIAIAIVPIIVGVFHYAKLAVPEAVDFSKDEIAQIIKPVETSSKNKTSNSDAYDADTDYTGSNPLAGLKLPFSVQKNFSDPKNMDVLKGWLEPMKQKDKEQFLNELDIVVQQAEAQKIDTTDAINRFWQEKAKAFRIREASMVAKSTQNYIHAGLVASAILTIAMFSLVLVLLAIERNTRK